MRKWWDERFTDVDVMPTSGPYGLSCSSHPGRCVVCDDVTAYWCGPGVGYLCSRRCLESWRTQHQLAAMASASQNCPSPLRTSEPLNTAPP